MRQVRIIGELPVRWFLGERNSWRGLQDGAEKIRTIVQTVEEEKCQGGVKI